MCVYVCIRVSMYVFIRVSVCAGAQTIILIFGLIFALPLFNY